MMKSRHIRERLASGLRVRDFTFIDLFAGIGGFHYGLSQCGGRCVMASEIDPIAADSYERNLGLKPLGDIYKIDSKDIPEFDLLCAGFPCQTFSNVGQKGGLDDPRGQLIFEVIRILKDKQPKAFILENVKGLQSINKGAILKMIVEKLDKTGYDVKYQILEAKDYGVPQIRKRLFIVGTRKDLKIEFEFPQKIGCEKKLSEILGGEVDREYGFTVRIGGRHSGINNKFNWDCYLVDGKPKYIRPEECLELQGFPRDYYLAGNTDAKYRQVGNSVPTTVVREIGLALLSTGIFD